MRFISNLVHVYFAADPVGKFVINLLVEDIRHPFNSFVTIAVRIELLLRMVDFPIQRAQVFLLSLFIIDALWVYIVLCITFVHVVAREQQEFDSLVIIIILVAVDFDATKTLLVKTKNSSALAI